MPTNYRVDREDALSSPTPRAPEDRLVFRLAQLVLLLEVAADAEVAVKSIDRLGYYDFFSANPFLVVQDDGNQESADRLTLRLAGFNETQLSYSSTGSQGAMQQTRRGAVVTRAGGG